MNDEDLSPYSRLIDILPEGATPTCWVASFEYLHPDGDLRLIHRMVAGTPPWKALGMVTSCANDLADSLREPAYAVDEEDDD